MTFIEALNKTDFQLLTHTLHRYASWRLRGLNHKKLQGLEANDLISEVLRKVVEGSRKWNPEIPIDTFLYMCLKSDIYNLLRKSKGLPALKEPETDIGYLVFDSDEEKLDAIEKLIAEGADDDEIQIFSCWTDGVTKPREVKEETGLDDKVFKTKAERLLKRLSKIQKIWEREIL